MDGGSLHSLLQLSGPFPEPVIAYISTQVLQGLLYLHKDRHLVHRDIKPSNILINTKGEVKISDFGQPLLFFFIIIFFIYLFFSSSSHIFPLSCSLQVSAGNLPRPFQVVCRGWER